MLSVDSQDSGHGVVSSTQPSGLACSGPAATKRERNGERVGSGVVMLARVRAALEAIVGPVDHFARVSGGYTHNNRVIASLRDGRSVFVKQAVDEETALWLRR